MLLLLCYAFLRGGSGGCRQQHLFVDHRQYSPGHGYGMSGGQVSLKYTHTPVGQSHLGSPVQVNLLQSNIIEE